LPPLPAACAVMGPPSRRGSHAPTAAARGREVPDYRREGLISQEHRV
jgi:hypothetical protein